MFVLEKEVAPLPNVRPWKGPAASFGDVFAAARDDQIRNWNTNSAYSRDFEAYQRMSDKLFAHTGQRIENPLSLNRSDDMVANGTVFGQGGLSADETRARLRQRFIDFNDRIRQLADSHPDQNVKVMAADIGREAERRMADVWDRSGGGASNLAAWFGGSMWGAMHDPLQLLSMVYGGGASSTFLRGVARSALVNAAGQAATEPFIWKGRADQGLNYSLGQAAGNVAMAGAFGGVFEAGMRGIGKGVAKLGQKADERMADKALDPDFTERATLGQKERADKALKAEPLEKRVERVTQAIKDGNDEALAKLVEDIDPAQADGLRDLARAHAMEKIGAKVEETGRLANMITSADGMQRSAGRQWIRSLWKGDEPPPVAPEPVPEAHGPMLADEASSPPPGHVETIDNKPVSFMKFDPATIETDAQTFQFKGGGDSAGVTQRLRTVETWNPTASGKTFVFEAADGRRFIGDGHQRLGLARRIGDPNIRLDGYLFREADGWTPRDVRVLAAKKNLQEGSGTTLDAASIIREAPHVIDKSVPLNSDQMTQARHLARLSDDAFGMVKNGIAPAHQAAMVGQLVENRDLHADLVRTLASAGIHSAEEARILIGQALDAGSTSVQQMTLFGLHEFQRSLLPERTKVMANALQNLRAQKRLFGLLDKHKGAIEAAGNQLDANANLTRAMQAGEFGEVIEILGRRKGPVSDALNRAAARHAEGASLQKARGQFLDELSDIMDKEGLNGLISGRSIDDAAPLPRDPIEPGSEAARAQAEEAANSPEFQFAMAREHAPEPLAEGASPALQLAGEDWTIAKHALDAGVVKEVDRIMKRLPEPLQVRFGKDLLDVGNGKKAEAVYAKKAKLIWVSLNAADPAAKLRHEEIHALRDLNLFTSKEWKALAAQADAMTAEVRAEIEATYKDVTGGEPRSTAERIAQNEKLTEEGVAHLFEGFRDGRRYGEVVDRIIYEMRQVLERIGNALRGRGFQTADDVFRRVERGDVGARAQAADAGGAISDRPQVAQGAVGHISERPGDLMFSLKRELDEIDAAGRLEGFGSGKAVVEPSLKSGFIRVYHSGAVGEGQAGRWVSTNRQYASDYRRDLPLHYLDLNKNDPRVNNPDYPDQGVDKGFTFNFELTPAEATQLREVHRDGKAAGADGAQPAAGQLRSALDERRRRAVLTVQMARRVESQLLSHRNAHGELDVAEGAKALLEHYGWSRHSSITNRRKVILGELHAELGSALHDFERTFWQGKTRNPARLDMALMELSGQQTGDEAARQFAAAFRRAAEMARQRFNAAGGSIAKLDKWWLPQMHDRRAVEAAGRDSWKQRITPMLDAENMVNPFRSEPGAEPVRGLTPQELDKALDHVYESIITEGWAHREPKRIPQGGVGALASRHQDHRFLQFKDGERWLTYAREFGGAAGASRDDLVLHAMTGYLNGMSKEIAMMEVLGPNPAAMLTYVKQIIDKEGAARKLGQNAALPQLDRDKTDAYVKSAKQTLDERWDALSGALDVAVDEKLAAGGQVVRDIEVMSKLGSAMLSALGDTATIGLTARHGGMEWGEAASTVRMIGQYLREDGRRMATEAGFINDEAAHLLEQETRFGGAVQMATRTGWWADRTLTWSGLTAWTQAAKRAFGMETMASFARSTGSSWDQLPAARRSLMSEYGFMPEDWELLRALPHWQPRNGTRFLRSRDLLDAANREALSAEMSRLGMFADAADMDRPRLEAEYLRGLHNRYMEMIYSEMQYAVPEGTNAGKTFMAMGQQRGTMKGEASRLFWQFKSYPITVLYMHGGRIARMMAQGERSRAGRYIAQGLLMTTLGGMLGLQLKDIKAGREPRDMKDARTWAAAFAQGGGLGIAGDFIFSDQSRFNASLLTTMAGPAFGDASKLAHLTVGNVQKALAGKKTSVGKDAVSLMRGLSGPPGSLWYATAAFNHLVLDQFQRMVDPDAHKAFSRMERNRRRDYNQDYWWRPGEALPFR